MSVFWAQSTSRESCNASRMIGRCDDINPGMISPKSHHRLENKIMRSRDSSKKGLCAPRLNEGTQQNSLCYYFTNDTLEIRTETLLPKKKKKKVWWKGRVPCLHKTAINFWRIDRLLASRPLPSSVQWKNQLILPWDKGHCNSITFSCQKNCRCSKKWSMAEFAPFDLKRRQTTNNARFGFR